MRTTRRPKADWVYRSDAYRSDGGSDDDGTYDRNPVTIATGISASDALVLYDSKRYMSQGLRGSTYVPTYYLPSAARSEGQRPRILRTQGHLRLTTSVWAVGSLLSFGFRIAVFEQDMLTGAALADANYGMFQGGGNTQAADWANHRRQNLFERRFYRAFSSDIPNVWNVFFNVPLRVRLDAGEGLFLYLETDASAVSTIVTTWCRTLVVDEGTG